MVFQPIEALLKLGDGWGLFRRQGDNGSGQENRAGRFVGHVGLRGKIRVGQRFSRRESAPLVRGAGLVFRHGVRVCTLERCIVEIISEAKFLSSQSLPPAMRVRQRNLARPPPDFIRGYTTDRPPDSEV